MKLEICILNPYTSKNSNEKLKKTAMKVIEEGSRIFINEDDLIDDYFSHHYETVNISNLIKQVEKNNSSDAFIVASFEDIGVDTIRKIISKPIIGIGEASFYIANIIANKFSVITNISQTHEAIKNNLIKYDMDHKCVSLKSIEVPILDMETMSKANIKKLENEIERTILEDSPEAIILTSAGIFDLTKKLSDKFSLPFIEGVGAATTLIQNLAKLDLRIKKFEKKPIRNLGIPI
ncbi:MAG: aspartate/glutamate racemase family protein [Proteobacteria bacterium]|nr:aspartate/glutamate racemase family protein [Pseudomonadota bacterium]